MEVPHQLTSDAALRYFWYIVGAFGGVGVILIGLAGFIAKIVLQKFSYALQNENNKEIESLKATIAQNNNKEIESLKAIITQNNAFAANLGVNHSATYQKLISKRLEVVEYYWQCILKAKEAIPNPVNLIYQILTDAETTVSGINKGKNLGLELSSVSLTNSSIELHKQSVEIDLKKPFISSKLWVLKYSYVSILGRSMYLLLSGYQNNNIILWKNDKMILQSMNLVLTNEEIKYASNLVIGGLPYIIELVENKIIDEINRFLSNDDFINDSAEQFKMIDKLTTRWSPETSGAVK